MESAPEQPAGPDPNKGLWQFAQDKSLTIAIALCWFLLELYPPRPGRYAAYWVIIPLSLSIGLIGNSDFRRAFGVTFERLPYPWRIAVTSLAVVIPVYFGVAVSHIPAPQPPPQEAQKGQLPARTPTITFMPTMPPAAEDVPSQEKQVTVASKARRRVEAKEAIAEDENAPQRVPPPTPSPNMPSNIRILPGR